MTSRHLPPALAAGAVIPPIIFLLLLFLLFLYLYFRHCRSSSTSASPIRRFSYRELHSATSGFASSRSLGRGASASVFLGTLAGGRSVAVKRISSGDREFLNELHLLSRLSPSRFVVSLLGYCVDGDRRRLIVCEHMSNGSLQDALFGRSRCRLRMDWGRRFRIIADVAKALAFLHGRDRPIIHGDLKPGNVLLGGDFEAKIADFGLSRLSSAQGKVDFNVPSSSSSSSSSCSSCLNHEGSASRICDDGKDERRVNPDWNEVQKSSFEFEEKGRKIREWWKEEYFAEISEKGKAGNHQGEDGEVSVNLCFGNGWRKKKKRSRSVCNEISTGEVGGARSMRGTVCYVAPEYGGCGDLTEKADVYNFGVLVLVIVSGRRPLHVLESPMKLDRANLVSWCRKLAQTGDVLEIVDEKLEDCYDKDQVRLCINLALLCLQRMPDLRPDSWDIVKVLEGEKELPVVLFENSPSPTN